MTAKRHPGEPSWKWRRWVIFPLTVYGCVELHLLIGAADTRVNETIAWGWFMLIGVLVLGYTGFATAQDIAAIMATRNATPYAPKADEYYAAADSLPDGQRPPGIY